MEALIQEPYALLSFLGTHLACTPNKEDIRI